LKKIKQSIVDEYVANIKEEEKKSWIEYVKISTNSTWKPIFDIILLFLVGYSCIINMYLVAYPVNPSEVLEVINWTVEIFFYIDFVLNFFQTYQDETTFEVTTDLKTIALKYIYGWFIIDLLSIIPFNVFLGE